MAGFFLSCVELLACIEIHYSSGSCDRASLTQEKKEPTDDTSIDILFKTASGVSLNVLAAIVWSQDTS